MAQRSNKKKDTKSDVKAAGKVVQKALPIKRLRRKSGFARALPYIMVFVGIVLAICLFTVRALGLEDGAGIIGAAVQAFVCGLLGGAAFLLPALVCFIGIVHIIFDVKWASSKRRNEEADEFSYASKRVAQKTVLFSIALLLFSALLGVIAADGSFDVAELWELGTQSFVSGGIIGGALGFLFYIALQRVISIIVIILLLIVLIAIGIGITPSFIANKIRCSRESREADAAYREEKYEKLRQEELLRAKARRQKQLEAQERKRIRKEMADEYFDDDGYVEPPMTTKQKRKTQQPSPISEDDIDSLTSELELDAVDSFGDPQPDALVIEEQPILQTYDMETPRDFGGDIMLDGGETGTIDDFIAGLGNTSPQAVPDEDILLGEISREDLEEDLADVLPEDSDAFVEEEPVLPYIFPSVDLLSPNKNPTDTDCQEELQRNARILRETLKSFKVDIKEINYSRGPTITRYELRPEVGTRVRSIANLVDDIALSLATSGVRIEAPIPNKPAVGIEVPNRVRATVYLRDLIENAKFTDPKSRLTSCLGMDVGGNPVYFDIGKMPHLLIAGTTGSGKSVCINTIILSILYKARPDEVKLILVDPKQVEFTVYENIPHLYCPIVSEPKKAAGALASAVSEMERRFELIKSVGVRNIEAYNEATANDPEKEYLPKMVIIIDELADLMMTARDEVETSICRLAQKARAAGIHVILGTQRPSVDVITGLIKANIPSRIACTVTSQVDSRTIIDVAGAETLIGYGDMLFAPVGALKPMRVQGAFVSDGEVEKIVGFIKDNNSPVKYNSAFITSMEENAKNCGIKKGTASAQGSDEGGSDGGDSKFREAVKLAIDEGKISTSLMQRKLSIGYGRAAKIIDSMEALGYVSKPDGAKPRRVLITLEQYLERVNEGTLGEE